MTCSVIRTAPFLVPGTFGVSGFVPRAGANYVFRSQHSTQLLFSSVSRAQNVVSRRLCSRAVVEGHNDLGVFIQVERTRGYSTDRNLESFSDCRIRFFIISFSPFSTSSAYIEISTGLSAFFSH